MQHGDRYDEANDYCHLYTPMNTEPRKRIENRMPVRHILVFWLFVLSAVAFLDRTNVSIAGLQISREFRIDNVQLGWVFSAFLVGYALFQVVGGWLAGYVGPRRVLAFGVLWWGLFTALTASVPPGMRGALWFLMLVRFALGTGEAVVYPAANQFVSQWIPVAERGTANGWIFAGVGAGAGLTPPLLTSVISRYGWRASFWLSAAVGIVAGALWYFAARDTPEHHPWVGAAELHRIRQGREANTSRADKPAIRPSADLTVTWRQIFTSSNVLTLTACYFAFGYVAWIFFSWFYIYLAHARELNLKTSAIYAMFPFLAMTVCCLAGGAASDWLTRNFGLRVGRCGLATVSLTLTALILIVGSRSASPRAAAIILAGGAGALYLSQSCFWSVTADIAGRHAGIVSGAMNMGGQIGGAVTASVTPLIATHVGWEASFFTAAFLALLSAIGWLLIDPAKTFSYSN
jgi:ACS family glucarate transporter-like MFS transporter